MKKICLTALLFLAACIEVTDFGGYWQRALVDPCITAIAHQSILEDKPKGLVRSLVIKGHLFMLIKSHPEDKGGSLIRYEIDNNVLKMYGLEERKRNEFLHYFPDTGVMLTRDSVTIPMLDAPALRLIADIAGQPDYWRTVERFAYNPNGNSACTF